MLPTLKRLTIAALFIAAALVGSIAGAALAAVLKPCTTCEGGQS